MNSMLEQAYQAKREGKTDDAMRLFEKLAAQARLSGDRRLLAGALKGLGQIERDRAHTELALAHYEEAATIERGLSDEPTMLAHTLRHVADILRELGRFSEAEPLYAEALELYRGSTNTGRLDLANALRGYALLGGDHAAARWREARDLYNECGVSAGVEECTRWLEEQQQSGQ